MKVRMKTLITGTIDGVRWPAPDGEFKVPDSVGVDLCERGYAEPVAEPEPKKAEKRAPKGKKGDR